MSLRGSGTYKISLFGCEDFQVRRPTGEDLNLAEISLVKGHDFTVSVTFTPSQNDKVMAGRLTFAGVSNKKVLNNIPLLGQSGKPGLSINGYDLGKQSPLKIQSSNLMVIHLGKTCQTLLIF